MTQMQDIVVCPLSRLSETAETYRPERMVSLISVGTEIHRPASISEANHLVLSFNDVTAPAPGLVCASNQDMDRYLAFIRAWPQKAPLLVHCWAGVSRSTAGAFIAAALLNGQQSEQALAALLRSRSPSATPNRLLISLADQALDRQGRMTTAIHAIGRGADCFEGEAFTMPAGGIDGPSR